MEENKVNSNIMSHILCIISNVLKQWRIVILAGCLCGLLVDVFSTLSYKPMYSARVQCAVVYDDDTGVVQGDIDHASNSIQYLLSSSYLQNKVNDKLSRDYFDGYVNYNLNDGTNFVSVSVVSSTQKDAYFQLKNLIDTYNDVSVKGSFGYKLTYIEDITFSNSPISYNNHIGNYKKGVILGLGLSIGIIALLSYFKDTIKDSKEVNDKLDVRLFAKVPREIKKTKKFFSDKKTALLVSHFKTGFSYIEAMNKLASKVEDTCKKNNYKSILITSSLENEGKSSVAVNLAISLAKNKKKVLVIDADFRKPALYKIFEYQPEFFLSDVLEGKNKMKECIVHLDKEHIDVMFNKPCDDSIDLLTHYDFKILLRTLKRDYDYIIIDSAPSRYISDTTMIGASADVAFIVVRQDSATSKVINDTIYRLNDTDTNIIGTIYNESVYDVFKGHATYGYRYGYYQYHRQGRSE